MSLINSLWEVQPYSSEQSQEVTCDSCELSVISSPWLCLVYSSELKRVIGRGWVHLEINNYVKIFVLWGLDWPSPPAGPRSPASKWPQVAPPHTRTRRSLRHWVRGQTYFSSSPPFWSHLHWPKTFLEFSSNVLLFTSLSKLFLLFSVFWKA